MGVGGDGLREPLECLRLGADDVLTRHRIIEEVIGGFQLQFGCRGQTSADKPGAERRGFCTFKTDSTSGLLESWIKTVRNFR